MGKLKMLSLFSGIGAIEKALNNLNISVELLGFSEIDEKAIDSYCAVHNVSKLLNLGDITKINIEKLPTCVDLITHGSPCQDFSISGKKKGGDEGSGTRSSLMWNTVEIVSHCKPKYVLWENVAGVLLEQNRHNFDKYISTLESFGYKNFYDVLNARQFGLPQNRERLFVLSVRNDIDLEYTFPTGEWDITTLGDFLDDEVDDRFIVKKHNSPRMTKNYLQYDNSGKGYNSQAARAYYINKFMCTLPKCNGGDKTQVLLSTNPNVIRRITPMEAWRLMGFDDVDYNTASKTKQTMGSLYGQAGNSICVPVVQAILKELLNDDL